MITLFADTKTIIYSQPHFLCGQMENWTLQIILGHGDDGNSTLRFIQPYRTSACFSIDPVGGISWAIA